MPHVVGIDLLGELAVGPPEALPAIPCFRASLRGDALALIKTEDLVDAAYSYNIVPLEKPGPAPSMLAAKRCLLHSYCL